MTGSKGEEHMFLLVTEAMSYQLRNKSIRLLLMKGTFTIVKSK